MEINWHLDELLRDFDEKMGAGIKRCIRLPGMKATPGKVGRATHCVNKVPIKNPPFRGGFEHLRSMLVR